MRKIEILLGFFGMGICLGSVYWAWRLPNSPLDSTQNSVLSPPGLYLIEMAVLGVLGMVGVVADSPPCSRRWGWVAWWAAGAILGFSVLGALTVGPLFLPAGIALLGAGILADRRRNQSLFRHLGILVLAGLLQAGLIIGLILLKSPNVQWGFSGGAYSQSSRKSRIACNGWAGSSLACVDLPSQGELG